MRYLFIEISSTENWGMGVGCRGEGRGHAKKNRKNQEGRGNKKKNQEIRRLGGQEEEVDWHEQYFAILGFFGFKKVLGDYNPAFHLVFPHELAQAIYF